MTKKILPLLLIFTLLLGSGCQTSVSVPGASSSPPAEAQQAVTSFASEAAFDKIVVDCNGRRVSIPANPRRVACLYASSAHIMALLGQEGKIVGAPKGTKRDILMLKKRPDIANISVPYNDGSINIEELIQNKVDLALLRRSTAAAAAETEKLEKAGIPYVVVDYASIDELKTAVRVCGAVFGCAEKAEAYVDFCDETLRFVEERLKTLPPGTQTRVFHAVNEAARTDLKGDLCSEIIALAGGLSVSTEGGSLVTEAEKTMTTLEQIYAWNPECFLVNEAATAAYIRSDSKWAGLQAVQQGKVVQLPVGVTRWCHPGSMEPQMGVLFIAERLYPQQFIDLDLKVYTKDYYERFFGLELSDEECIAILSGEGMRMPKN